MEEMGKIVFRIPSRKAQYDEQQKGNGDKSGRCGLNQKRRQK